MGAFNYGELVKQAQESGASTSYEPVPAGDYEVVVEAVDCKPTKKGDPMLTLTLKVVDGEAKNRKFWHRMAFIPGNGVGLAINFRQLDALGATPLLEQGGTLEQVAGFIKNKRAVAKIGFGKDSYSDKNEVKDLKASAAAQFDPANPPSTGPYMSPILPQTAAPAAPRPF